MSGKDKIGFVRALEEARYKNEFKRIFNKDWKDEPQLYISFVQGIQVSSINNVLYQFATNLSDNNEKMQITLSNISQKLEKGNNPLK